MSPTLHLFTVLIAAVVWLTRYVESAPLSADCPSNDYTATGDCCRQCAAGYGIHSRCTPFNNTECVQCEADVSYSLEASHTADCLPCGRCAGNQYVGRPCNTTHDTLCECRTNYYQATDGSCSQCNTCPPGYGATVACSTLHNSRCEACGNDSFSDVTSATGSCLPCTVCSEGTVPTHECTRFADTKCSGKPLQITNEPTSANGNTNSVVYTPDGTSHSIVPIYCAILAFVVIGLLGYVVFKRWSFHKVKMRGQAKSTRSQTGSPSEVDTEKAAGKNKKLGATSVRGSTSMSSSERQHDRVPLMAVPSSTLYRDLPTQTRSEVEGLLGMSRLDRRDWRGLAHELGFTDRDVVHFIKTSEEDLPVHRVLVVWSAGEGAVVGVLFTALQRMNRQDVLSKLPICA